MAHTCAPSGLEIEAGGSGVEGHYQLCRKLEASLGYMRSCLKCLLNASSSWRYQTWVVLSVG